MVVSHEAKEEVARDTPNGIKTHTHEHFTTML